MPTLQDNKLVKQQEDTEPLAQETGVPNKSSTRTFLEKCGQQLGLSDMSDMSLSTNEGDEFVHDYDENPAIEVSLQKAMKGVSSKVSTDEIMEQVFEKDYDSFKSKLSDLDDTRLKHIISQISSNPEAVIEDLCKEDGGLSLIEDFREADEKSKAKFQLYLIRAQIIKVPQFAQFYREMPQQTETAPNVSKAPINEQVQGSSAEVSQIVPKTPHLEDHRRESEPVLLEEEKKGSLSDAQKPAFNDGKTVKVVTTRPMQSQTPNIPSIPNIPDQEERPLTE